MHNCINKYIYIYTLDAGWGGAKTPHPLDHLDAKTLDVKALATKALDAKTVDAQAVDAKTEKHTK